VTNLLFNVNDAQVTSDLLCNPSVGSACSLANTCATYTNLWTYSFKVQFADQLNYVNVPLAAFAVDNTATNGCDLYIQYLNSNQESQSSQIVLGSMFLQQYVNVWDYDNKSGTATYIAELSSSCTLNGAYIGAGATTAGSDPFMSLAGSKQTIYVNTDDVHFQTTIGAQLGFQGSKQFGVSLLGKYVQTWSSDCLLKLGGQRFRSCAESPVFATNYFDENTYFNDTNSYAAGGIYDGYDTTGLVYNASVCVKTATTNYFCTIEN